MNVIQTGFSVDNSHIAIVVSRFNKLINISLLEGATDALKRFGNVKDENITVVWVPGAYEIPLIANSLAKTNKYDAIVVIGTIIRGKTDHFKYIAHSVKDGLTYLTQNINIPIAFGLLTTENVEQAIVRAGVKSGNKGVEAALTALEMINLLKAVIN